jgi:hypothetical protein
MSHEYTERLSRLAKSWCDRHALKPLFHFLPGYFALNGLTDGYAALAEALRDTLALAKNEITEAEKTELRTLLAEADSAVYRK